MKKIEFVLNCYCHYFELNELVSNDNLKVFFEAILKENNIDVSNIKNELLKKINEWKLIYPGGMTFYEDAKSFSTGCCFDLNDIKEACTAIKNSERTWLGHDPNTVINYINDKVIVFESDDFDSNQEPDENETLEYTKEEIEKLIDNANNKFKQFIDVFYDYLKDNYSDIADILIEDLKKYLL